MISIAIAFVAAAFAQDGNALQQNLGMWNTNKSFCGNGAQCIGIANRSYTECVAVGIAGGDMALQLGNMVFLNGNAQTSVWIPDGRDADQNLDIRSCIPPRTTVWGPIPTNWTSVQFQTIKYYVGDVRTTSVADLSYFDNIPNPINPAQPLTGQFFGQYYNGTGQGLTCRATNGNINNTYPLNEYAGRAMGVGG